MILSIAEQAAVFVFVFVSGLSSGAFYDLIEILRMNIKHSRMAVYTEDIIYWLVVIVTLFLFLLDKNYADIRLFNIAGFFFGMIIYNVFLSPTIIKILMIIIRIIRKILRLLFEIILTPFKLIWLVIGSPIKKASGFVSLRCKKVLHLSSVYAKMSKRKFADQMRFIRHKKE
ncbi:hypothetical protein IMSAG049_00926 [Clostridiales bacterium]|nr:hypothetical protein IMSAG049_00926 [Clostridiales bacterium]